MIKNSKRRSRKGCLECRKRKIKCDEAKPTCGQCERNALRCSIVDSIFKFDARSFRTRSKQSGSPADEVAHVSPSLPEISLDAAWNERGPNTTHVQGEEIWPVPGAHRGTPLHGQQPSHFGQLQTQSEAQGSENRGSSCASPFDPPALSGEYTHNPDSDSGNSTSTAESHTEAPDYHTQRSPDSVDDPDECAFFMRQYGEGIAKSMDLFSTDRYFSVHLMSLANTNNLVKYAACALVAKQMGQMENPTSKVRVTKAQSMVMKTIEESNLEYTWYGAKYYEPAIQKLASEISSADCNSSHPSPSNMYDNGSLGRVNRSTTKIYSEGSSWGRLVAACLLLGYERLSATLKAIHGHLNGVYRLLAVNNPSPWSTPEMESPEARNFLFQARRSLFWFFCFHDWEESFITETETIIPASDMALWRSMGLRFGEGYAMDRHEYPQHASDNLYFFELLWLLYGLNNKCNSTSSPATPEGNQQGAAAPLEDDKEWDSLANSLKEWYDNLPSHLHPNSQVSLNIEDRYEVFREEIWCSNNIGTLSMMYYYMAQILLAIQRPSSLTIGTGTVDILKAYRNLQGRLLKYASKIIAIASGMPSDEVIVYTIQPLYVAGRCLRQPSDRQRLVEMLKKIETEYGVVVDYRIKDLEKEWGETD